ncbi:MAG: KH domain-containing protein [Candidatus Thermoplasmatota archaeon]|nr:KH domain-containing protein [Candidatus Thermoplasmatota archaeon]MBU1940402.1 KH domain-containing protein [Candidatus Thermoplasmatota archaeon]
MKYLKIPKERIGVLIGPEGETKKTIEDHTHVTLIIDSEEGEVILDNHNSEDPLGLLNAEDVVRAIGRGFSPEHALLLLKDDVELFLFDIRDYVGKKKTHIHRLKSRIIGTQGKTKNTMEQLTGAILCIHGHTIGIIADFEVMESAKKAIDMLLSGSKHASVYRYLEREMKHLRLGL